MKINTIGIPSYAGALYSGTEAAPQALRSANLVERLQSSGWDVSDFGDLQSGPTSVRHNIPPLRNWPLPRVVWDTILQDTSHDWFSSDDLEMILGGDCSIVVGSFQRMVSKYGEKARLIVIDAHFDGVMPRADKCLGAAASGLWFLTHDSLLWNNPYPTNPEQIRVLGCQQMPDQTYGIGVASLVQMRETGVRETVASLLAEVPEDAKILIHFDVDVIGQNEMPAAYSPSEDGLTLHECHSLLQELFRDKRTVGIEITELSALRDGNGECARSIVSLLSDHLQERSTK